MKYESIVNQSGSTTGDWSAYRIVGFRILASEIENAKGSNYRTHPMIIEDLAAQYLKDKGYTVEKNS